MILKHQKVSVPNASEGFKLIALLATALPVAIRPKECNASQWGVYVAMG